MEGEHENPHGNFLSVLPIMHGIVSYSAMSNRPIV